MDPAVDEDGAEDVWMMRWSVNGGLEAMYVRIPPGYDFLNGEHHELLAGQADRQCCRHR